MEFSVTELDEAVSEVLGGSSPGSGLCSGSLIQDIGSPNPEERITETVVHRQSMKVIDQHAPLKPVVSDGVGASNLTAVVVSHDPNTSGIRQPIALHTTTMTQGNPTSTAPNLSSPMKQSLPFTAASILSTNSSTTTQLHQVPNQPMMENWMDVAHTTNTNHAVKFCYQTNEDLLALPANAPVWQMPAFANKRIDLLQSQTYMFRVAAVNSGGRGPWSEVAVYKTGDPAFPGAPMNVKVSKVKGGAVLIWEDDPRIQCGPITEYSVYLSIVPGPNETDLTKMSFIKVYCGTAKHCTVSTQTLSLALIDTSAGNSAVIFRIAARNSSSYGPATQIRWVQEPASAVISPRPALKHDGTNGSGRGGGTL